MKLLFGTRNPAKLRAMRACVRGLCARDPSVCDSEVEILGLDDIECAVGDVDESGNDPLENARIKVRAYARAARMPAFSCDSGLYIEGVPPERQPGVHVRNVGGRSLSDGEMTAHYGATARSLGGRAIARYQNAICLAFDEYEEYEHAGEDIASARFALVPVPHARRERGFPLDALSVDLGSGRYYYDLPDERSLAGSSDEGFRGFFERALSMHARRGEIARSVAPCGLVCALCHMRETCAGCDAPENSCARRHARGCVQHSCAKERNIAGCWECGNFCCGRDMFDASRDIRLRAFVRFVREHGTYALAGALLRNEARGIYYGHGRDYDGLADEKAVLSLLYPA